VKAIVWTKYGRPDDVLEVHDVDKSLVGPDEVLVRTVNHVDLVVLKKLIEAGKVTPVIDRTYPLSETREAFGYLDEGHARGKVVITMEPRSS